MVRGMTVEEAAEIIAGAFAPLRCVAEPWDGGFRVRFRVFDQSEEPLLHVKDLTRPQVTDPSRLESIINQVRNRLIQRGYALNPWTYPGSGAGVS